jgi:hypothetical protein
LGGVTILKTGEITMIMREVEIGRRKEIGLNARETIPSAVRALETR